MGSAAQGLVSSMKFFSSLTFLSFPLLLPVPSTAKIVWSILVLVKNWIILVGMAGLSHFHSQG